MAQHNDLGKWGETIAVDALVAEGCAILERNWRSGHYEIDIIAMRGRYIVFAEVKTRSGDSEDPFRALDRKKLVRMLRAAQSYIESYDIAHEPQFDFFAISGNPLEYHIEHIRDITMPIMRTYGRR